MRWRNVKAWAFRAFLLAVLVAGGLLIIEFLFSLGGYDPRLDEPKDFEGR